MENIDDKLLTLLVEARNNATGSPPEVSKESGHKSTNRRLYEKSSAMKNDDSQKNKNQQLYRIETKRRWVEDGSVGNDKSFFSIHACLFVLSITAVILAATHFIVGKTNSSAVDYPTNTSQKQYVTKNIEDVRIGERTLGANPQGRLQDESDDSVFKTIHFCGYSLQKTEDDGSVCKVQLLRPDNWLDEELVRVRRKEDGTIVESSDPTEDIFSKENELEVWLELPEMGVVGWAELLEVDPTVEIQEGAGNIVTGTFAHSADSIVDLYIEGQNDPIGCTNNHPFWSVDRQDFVEAGELHEGERLQLYSGETKRVVKKLPRPGPQYVYNLEVYGEHVYQVTTDGVLVHNVCKLGRNMLKAGIKPNGIPNPQAHHDLPQKYRDKFDALHIDIDNPKYGRWVSGSPIGSHQSWTHAFNEEWDKFFLDFEKINRKPTKNDVESFMNQLRNSGKYE